MYDFSDEDAPPPEDWESDPPEEEIAMLFNGSLGNLLVSDDPLTHTIQLARDEVLLEFTERMRELQQRNGPWEEAELIAVSLFDRGFDLGQQTGQLPDFYPGMECQTF